MRALADNVAALSQDQYGCRVIQKAPRNKEEFHKGFWGCPRLSSAPELVQAIQAVSKESQQQIARELEDHVESCIRTARQKLTLWSSDQLNCGNARVPFFNRVTRGKIPSARVVIAKMVLDVGSSSESKSLHSDSNDNINTHSHSNSTRNNNHCLLGQLRHALTHPVSLELSAPMPRQAVEET